MGAAWLRRFLLIYAVPDIWELFHTLLVRYLSCSAENSSKMLSVIRHGSGSFFLVIELEQWLVRDVCYCLVSVRWVCGISYADIVLRWRSWSLIDSMAHISCYGIFTDEFKFCDLSMVKVCCIRPLSLYLTYTKHDSRNSSSCCAITLRFVCLSQFVNDSAFTKFVAVVHNGRRGFYLLILVAWSALSGICYVPRYSARYSPSLVPVCVWYDIYYSWKISDRYKYSLSREISLRGKRENL